MSKHNLCYIYQGKDVQRNLNVTVYKAEIYKCYVNVYFGGLIFEISC